MVKKKRKDLKNIPELRFKEFEGEWEEKKLGEVADVVMGQSPKSKSYNENNIGKYLIQGNADLFDRVTMPRIYTSEITKECNIGDILMTVRAPVGYIAKSLHNACIGRGVCAIKDKGLVNLNFLYQFLLYFEKKWHFLEQGSTFNAVSTKDIKMLKFCFPSLPEQQKISSFLTLVDKRIELLKKKKELLEKYKKGVMQKIFKQEIRFKDENGNEFPEWEEKKLGDLATFHKGSALSKSDLRDLGANKCIHYGELFTLYKEIITDIVSRTDKEGVTGITGDILMPSSDVTPRGLAKASSLQVKDVVLGGDINIIRPFKGLNSIFLSYQLNAIPKKILRLVTGTTVMHIYNSDIKNLLVFKPIGVEQQKISSFLTLVDKNIKILENTLNSSKLFKKSLLQKMFV